MADPKGPLVSVIIPTYNSARFIRPTLRSALRQTHTNIEVIVVDDGSQDDSAEIVAQMAHEDPRLRLICQPNRGVAAARNRAITAANGAFIAPLDGDDIWHPQKIAKELAVFERHGPELGLVYAWTQRIDADGYALPGQVIKFTVKGRCFETIIHTNPVGHSSGSLIRREAIEHVGGFDEGLREAGAGGCEDQKLYLDIAEDYAFDYVPEILIGYRKHPDSMSRDISKVLHSYEYVLNLVRKKHPELPQNLFRRSRTKAVFWLVTDTGVPGVKNTNLGLLIKTLIGDPLFMCSAWFTRYMARRALRFPVRQARALGLLPPRKTSRQTELFWPQLYDDVDNSVVPAPPEHRSNATLKTPHSAV